MKKILKFFIKFIVSLFLILIAFGSPAIYGLGKMLWYKNHPISFEQSAWFSAKKEGYANSSYVRLQMASNLINANVLTHKNETEIINMLGEPQNHRAIPGSAYWLAPYSLDSVWLQIIYEKGFPISIDIVTD